MFQAASVGKMMMAVAVLEPATERTLRLDDPVSRVVSGSTRRLARSLRISYCRRCPARDIPGAHLARLAIAFLGETQIDRRRASSRHVAIRGRWENCW